MTGNVTTLSLLLTQGGSWEFFVPIYQRDYVWDTAQFDVFIESLTSNTPKYFNNIIVYDHNPGSSNYSYEIIDGQQRLTSIYLFLFALYNHSSKNTFNLTSALLQNILFTQQNNGHLRLQGNNNITNLINNLTSGCYLDNYNRAINWMTNNVKNDQSGMNFVQTTLANKFIGIVHVQNSDSIANNEIFEEINSNGVELLNYELILSHILNGITPQQQQAFYNNTWTQIRNQKNQFNIDDENFENIFFYFTVYHVKHSIVKKNFFRVFKQLWIDNGLDLSWFAQNFSAFFEFYLNIAKTGMGNEYTLFRILKNYTSMPLLYAFSVNNPVTFMQNFHQINSLLLRRRLTHAGSSGLATPIYDAVKSMTIPSRLMIDTHSVLIQNITYTEDEVKIIIGVLNGTYDFPDGATLEHIYPQTPNLVNWPNPINQALISDLGNMTILTHAQNAQAGNSDFITKRDIYIKSRFIINNYFATVNQWNTDKIYTRKQDLLKGILQIY